MRLQGTPKTVPLRLVVRNRRIHMKIPQLLILGCVITTTTLFAQDIMSLAEGRISFESITNGRYKVEWKSTLDETNWKTDLLFQELISTGTITDVAVPFYYRILWLNPPPYNISGIVRFAGTPLTNLSDNILISGIDNGHVDQSAIGNDTGAYSFSNLSNGSYQISLIVDNYIPYQVERDILNDNLAHDIDLVVPLQPVSPTNGHAQHDTSITLEWEHNPLVVSSDVILFRISPDIVPIPIAWKYHENTHSLSELEPGTYNWRVNTYNQWYQLCPPQFTFFPVGQFQDWMEFTIAEP